MQQSRSVSRRDFLKTLMTGAGAAVLAPHGLALAQSSGAAAAPRAQSNIVITTTGWPLNPLPTPEEIEADAALAGYAAGLQAWLDENPGVSFERIEANIWDQQSIVTAIAGGIAPTYIYPLSVGGFNTASMRNAFAQGLIKDVTPAVEEFGLLDKLTDGARGGYEPIFKAGDGFLGYPIDSGMDMFWFRRDLLAEAGVEEPPVDWTWDDLFALARALTTPDRKGMGAQVWIAGALLGDHGFDLLSRLPAPDTGWNWLRDTVGPEYAALLEEYRKLIFEDGAVYSDVALTDNSGYRAAFVNGATGIARENILGAFGRITQEDSLVAFAQSNGLAYEEMFGFRPVPRGRNGYANQPLYVGSVGITPDASDEVALAALSAVDFMFLGRGWDLQKAGQYEATQDLTAVFNYPLPIDGKYEYEGVPGSFVDAWGQRTLDDILAAAARPKAPEEALFMPLEQNPGPDSTPFNDAWSTINYVADGVDPAAVLQQAVETWNAQASGFSSSIPDEEFVAAAQAYYAAVDAFWAEASPDFHANVFRAWYESKVLPVLG